MADEQKAKPDADQSMVYQIKIKGSLSQPRMDWFDGLTITLDEDGNTLLFGTMTDQAALYGILKRIRDLGLPLLSVNTDGPGALNKEPVSHE
jgi:hypothetical protein